MVLQRGVSVVFQDTIDLSVRAVIFDCYLTQLLTKEMKMKLLVTSVVSTLLVASMSAQALTSSDLYGAPAQPAVADRTVVVDDNTKWLNVTKGEVVDLQVNGKEFAWEFDGIQNVFTLNEITPEGLLDHRVTVYVDDISDK
jgi:hypothetical protein